MASIISASINLESIPKDKIVIGKKGKYLNIIVSVNDETDRFGYNANVSVGQTKEERDNNEKKVYLGNGKVVWNNGEIENADSKRKSNVGKPAGPAPVDADDLPF